MRCERGGRGVRKTACIIMMCWQRQAEVEIEHCILSHNIALPSLLLLHLLLLYSYEKLARHITYNIISLLQLSASSKYKQNIIRDSTIPLEEAHHLIITAAN